VRAVSWVWMAARFSSSSVNRAMSRLRSAVMAADPGGRLARASISRAWAFSAPSIWRSCSRRSRGT
jgi:hypothetical protein